MGRACCMSGFGTRAIACYDEFATFGLCCLRFCGCCVAVLLLRLHLLVLLFAAVWACALFCLLFLVVALF
jgi:hypothetical protein